MKNINEILNSLLQPASETKVFPKEKAIVPVNGSEGETSSFEDILAKLASEDIEQGPTGGSGQVLPDPVQGEILPAAPDSARGSFFESVTTITEIDIHITETARLSGADPKLLEKLEQSLMSLAAGLSKLLQLVSSLQFVDPAKAQDLLVSASGGAISPKDAKDLTDLLSLANKNIGADQNPLLLSFAQQNGLLNQMFQQMLNDQQILFGQPTGVGAAAGGGPQVSDLSLQMSFSETDVTLIRSADSQSSQVFVNLQSFQMMATFVQTGSGAVLSQNPELHQNSSFQQLSPENLTALSAKLGQAFSNAGVSDLSALATSPMGNQGVAAQGDFPNGLDKNFKNLVQLLMQTGVSQAVLTTFLSQQKNFSNSELQTALAQNLSLDHLLQILIPPAKIVPIESANSTSDTQNNTENPNPAIQGRVFVEEVVVQESLLVESQALSLTPTGATLNRQVAATVLQESTLIQAQNSSTSLPILNSESLQPVVGANSSSSASASLIDTKILAAINETVVRFNGFVSQRTEAIDPGTSSIRTSQVDQFLAGLGVDLSTPLSPSGPLDRGPNPVEISLSPNSGLVEGSAIPNNVLDVVNVSSTQLIQVALSSDSFSFSSTGAGSALGETVFQLNELSVTSVQTLSLSTTSLKGEKPQDLNPGLLKVQETIGPGGISVEVEMTDPLGMSIQTKAKISAPENLLPLSTTPLSVAQNISVSVTAGEAVKNSLTSLVPGKNENPNQHAVVNTLSPASEIKPITPQAVTSVPSGGVMNPLLNALEEQAKNGNNFSASVQIAASAGVNQIHVAVGTTHEVSAQSNVPNQAQVAALDSAHVLNQISEHLSRHASEIRAVSRLDFQLMPESLGRITVQIALVDQSVSARIVVSNPEVRETLQHHMVELKTALNQAGLQIDQLQVQVQGGSSNLLAQYFQYQQEGFGYRLPASLASPPPEEAKNLENIGVLGEMSVRMSLLDVLV